MGRELSIKPSLTGRIFKIFQSVSRFSSILLLSLSFSSAPSFSNPVKIQQYQKQDELIIALLNNDSIKRIQLLLVEHNSLVTVSLWENLIGRAELAYYTSGLDKSLHIYHVALETAKFLKNKRSLGLTHYYIGRAYAGKYKIKEAIQAYLTCKVVFEEAGIQRDLTYILAGLGSLYYYIEDYNQAEYYSEQCIELAEKLKGTGAPAGLWPESYGVASALSTLSGINRRDGDYDRAVSLLQKSLELYREMANGSMKFGFQTTDVLADLGVVHNEAGNNVEAVKFLNQALELAQRLPYKDRTARVLNNLGVLYLEQEDYEKAGYFLNQSLQIFNQFNNRLEVSRALLNLGVIEYRRRNYDQAVDRLNHSLQLSTESSYKDVIIAARSGLSAIYKVRGDYKTALKELDISLPLANEIEDKTRTAEILWRKAEVMYELGDFVEAAMLSEQSLKLAREMRFFNLSYYAATLLGKSQLAQKKMDLAFQTLSNAIEWVEDARNRVIGREEGQAYFFENKLSPYHALIGLLVDEVRPLEALRFAERAKGRILLDVFQRGRVDLTESMSEKEKEEARHLNRLIIRGNTELRAELSKQSPLAAKISLLKEQLDSARLNYSIFENALYSYRPELNARRGQTPLFELENLSRIDPDGETAFIQYVVTKERLHIFALTNDGMGFNLTVHSESIKEDELADRVKNYHYQMASRAAAFSTLSGELYALLLKPIESRISLKNKLCIIPDGILWDVPFQALRSQTGRFLIEDHAIYYSHSFSTLIEMARRNGKDKNRMMNDLLAIANPRIESDRIREIRTRHNDGSFDPLSESEIEVKAISHIITQSKSKVYIGAEAKEKMFKSLATQSRVIHFATHGVIDNRNPLYSFLVLSKEPNDSNEDGLLEGREIMNLKLTADLAVLSACETARGKIGAGEGVIGMSWAFFIAGCRTTTVSQWKVNSASTSELMINFYRSLKDSIGRGKASKAEALRHAGLKVMKNRRFRHPYYWAGFVVVGSDN